MQVHMRQFGLLGPKDKALGQIQHVRMHACKPYLVSMHHVDGELTCLLLLHVGETSNTDVIPRL